jgi:hypothetical protein
VPDDKNMLIADGSVGDAALHDNGQTQQPSGASNGDMSGIGGADQLVDTDIAAQLSG